MSDRSQSRTGPGPLNGYRIVDLSRVLSGPAATMLLADQGADVIKIEPLEGDITRHMGVGKDGMTSAFLNINRGKRALALDLKNAEGLAIVRRLIRTADVVVQNFRPGAADRLGLGEEAVRAIKPDIIYVSISGFGKTGPYVHKRVYDPVIQALSGITDIQADNDTGRPRMIRTVIPDKTTALTAAQAMTAALLARERTGQGTHVELAMLDAMIAYIWPEGMMNLTFVDDERKAGVGQVAQDLVFRTRDGYLTAGAMSDDEWRGMCTAISRPEWIDDPRFNSPQARFLNAGERIAATGEVFETDTTSVWLERLDANGVPCAPVLTRPEVLSNEQVIANELIHTYEHPGIGPVRQPRPAARFSGMEMNHQPRAPRLGAHNQEILQELGYDNNAIESLKKDGVVSDRGGA